MLSSRIRISLLAAAATACSALLAFSGSPAIAAPDSDAQGYIDSTARCASPSTVAVFGSTSGSRIAICKSSDGTYQYRGVRVSDGAKLITSASQTGSGGFTAVNDGITYTVTSSSLTVTSGNSVVRQEAWVDFHGSAGTKSTGTAAPTATAGPTATGSPSATATAAATPTATATATVTATATPTAPAAPLPPPLPAEVGGGSR